MALTDKLTAIGDALRQKLGQPAVMFRLDDIPRAIESLGTGGGSDEDYYTELLDGSITKLHNNKVTRLNFPLTNQFLPNLESIYLPNCEDLGREYASHLANLRYVCLPKIRRIESNMFQGCEALEKVDLESVEEIGQASFNFCQNLAALIIRTPTVCRMNSNLFQTAIKNGRGKIYVPDALIADYVHDSSWSEFPPFMFEPIEYNEDICARELLKD